MSAGCFDPLHFREDNGVISPQPWMFWRPVGTVRAPGKATTYNVSGGGNKNELIHNLQQNWVNDSPVPQWAYGLISRGGATVTLQARSRGGLSLLSGSSGYNELVREDWEGSVTAWPSLPSNFTVATDAFYSGSKSLKLAGAAGTQSVTRNGTFPVSPGDLVTLTARVRRDNTYAGTGTANGVVLIARNQANTSSPWPNSGSAIVLTTALVPALQWTYVTKTFVVPVGVTGIRVAVVGAHTAGNVWVDDIVLARGTSDPELVEASIMGIGAEMGRGGLLATGASFGTMEARQNSVTIPLSPERTGWTRIEPGGTFIAKAQLRFITQFWENTVIDGGDTGTMSGWNCGDTQLDLFAVPIL